MKKLILSVLLLSALTSYAGPGVSGGMPDQVRCGTQSDIYQLQVMVLGESGGGTVLEATPTGQLPINVHCLAKNAIVASIPGTTLLYTCGSEEDAEFVEIFKQSNPYQRWAIVYRKLVSGRAVPITLKCQ